MGHPILDVVVSILLCLYYTLEGIVISLIPSKFKSKSIEGDVALVTGGGSGIGRMICVELVKLGATVVTWDVNKAGNDETLKLIKNAGGKAFGYVVDLTDKEAIYKAAIQIKNEVGRVTILVNNAGIVTGKPLLDSPDKLIQRTFDVNVLAHFWTVKAFLPDMLINDKGHIVTVASLAGLSGCNKLVDYCASKFAAVGFDESLRIELKVAGKNNIKTTVVCPYYVKTPLFEGASSKILPILEPEQVAAETINGILTNKEMVIIPGSCAVLAALKTMLNWKAVYAVLHVTGITASMDEFRGRKVPLKGD
ncbi:epidermal retinol dehydrogenase 2-like isoform X2 [Artemia franciscana]